MLLTFTANFLITISILGYSLILKNYIFENKTKNLCYIDLLFGFFLLIFISIFFNFFVPLAIVTLLVFFFGIIIFLIFFFKNKININYLGLIIILLFFSFIFYDNGNNVDSAVYHIQTIKWANLYKVTIGLSNLDWLYPLNSSWHILLALFKFQIKDFNTIYVFNIIPLTLIYYEIFFSKTSHKNLSYLTLYFSGVYLIVFSVIHPFRNGVIFNHYGNPEVDLIGMSFFILSIYIFLKYFEEKDKYYFDLLLISSFLCVTAKITYAGVVLFPLYILIYEKFNFLKTKIIFITSLVSLFWMIRGFLLSSCFVYPVKFTCLNTQWFFGEEKLIQLVNLTKGFSRDTRLRERYTDFEHVIYSYDWLVPWFKDYFLNTKMIWISCFILILSMLIISISIFLKKKNNNRYPLYFLIFCFLLNILIWFQAPEIRFGWGILIAFPCLFLAFAILNLLNYKIFKYKNVFLGVIFIFFSLSLFKNFKNFTFNKLITPYEKKWDYTNIVSIGKFNGEEFFLSNNWKCADFKKICVNTKKNNYVVLRKYNYLIFLNENQKKN